jgi:hypothetical protein
VNKPQSQQKITATGKPPMPSNPSWHFPQANPPPYSAAEPGSRISRQNLTTMQNKAAVRR